MLKGGNGMKSKVVALILSVFLGELGIDRLLSWLPLQVLTQNN